MPPVGPSWLGPSVEVEVAMAEEGLLSSRYRATVLDSLSAGKAHIQFKDFNEEGEDGGESEVLLKEWVPFEMLRPLPPPPPSGFFTKLKVGTPLESLFEDGWWDVTLDAIDKQRKPDCYNVGSSVYDTSRWVDQTTLRPRWTFRDGKWDTGIADAAPPRKAGGKGKADPKAARAEEPAAKKSRSGSSGGGASRGGGSGSSSAATGSARPRSGTSRSRTSSGGGTGAASTTSVSASRPPPASSATVTGGASAAAAAPAAGLVTGLPLKQRVEKVLKHPMGLFGTIWIADAVDAHLSRLQKIAEKEKAAQGVPDEIVDLRLWPGAAESGWRVHDRRGDGHYEYVSPDGARMHSKVEALALGDEHKKSARQMARAAVAPQ